MELKFTHGVIILVITASMFSVSMGMKDLFFDFKPQQSREIIVGGPELWHYGFNYVDWATKNTPFFPQDTLVFKYDAPNATTFPHNVIQFHDKKSYDQCDVKNAKLLANTTQGGGEGFKFVLKTTKQYLFACGVENGLHCNNGTMKFSVKPVLRL